MNFHDLLNAIPHPQVIGPIVPTARTITSLAYDSRQVQPGSLFIAIKGTRVDGHGFIADAVQRGAAAVVVDAEDWQQAATTAALNQQGLPHPSFVVVPHSRTVLAPLAAAFYHYPAQQLGMIGVTGTKGKTTTTTLLSMALEGGGYSTGMINSVDFKINGRWWPNTTRQSTPEAPEVQAMLYEMVGARCDYAILEATSHALSARWQRVDYCAFDVALFTNLSHEHLDYHGSFAQYRQDKARLFQMLGEELPHVGPDHAVKARKWAIVNRDDPEYSFFLEAAPTFAHRLSYGLHPHADVRAVDVQATPHGSHMQVITPWNVAPLKLQLPGMFNVSNALAAIAVAAAQGVTLHQVCAALGKVRGVRGRMQPVESGQPFGVIIDYAHNPASFEQVFAMLRPLTRGRLIAVFGSAGERDTEKRPLQGKVAARYCDLLVLTDEDPRREDPEHILAQIAAGAKEAGRQQGSDYLLIADRTTAIRTAFEQAQPDDLVLLLGKGHETSIEYADGKHPWDEEEVARTALHQMGYGSEEPASGQA